MRSSSHGMLKMASSWAWHWRAPGARGFYPALLRRLLAGRWIKIQLELVFSAAKFNWTQKVDGGCKRRLFSAEAPSPTEAQKQQACQSASPRRPHYERGRPWKGYSCQAQRAWLHAGTVVSEKLVQPVFRGRVDIAPAGAIAARHVRASASASSGSVSAHP